MNTFTPQSFNFVQVGDFNANKCQKCHRPFWDMGESTAPIPVCECWKMNQPNVPYQPYPYQPFNIPAPIQMGWKCPCCGGGVAPGVERCPCTPIVTITTTSTGAWLRDMTVTIDNEGNSSIEPMQTKPKRKAKKSPKK